MALRNWNADVETGRGSANSVFVNADSTHCWHNIEVSKIAKSIEVSKPYATLIRRGKRIPHPRHWSDSRDHSLGSKLREQLVHFS